MTGTRLGTAVADFTHAIGLLVRRVRVAGASDGLSWTESSVMTRLDKEGSSTTAELARAEGVKPQSMGTIVATLEGMGIVARKPHPTDGRQMNIELTAKGLSIRKTAKDAKLSWLVQVVSQLDEKERETLFAAGKIIERLIEK